MKEPGRGNGKANRVYTIHNLKDHHVDLYKLLKAGPKQRQEFIDLTGWSRTTVFDRLFIMEYLKMVERFKEGNGKPGRSVVKWRLTNKADAIIELHLESQFSYQATT